MTIIHLKKRLSSPIVRSLLSAIAGFVVYGAWAYWINSSEGSERALVSALTQGSYSFIITLVLNFFMEWFYHYLVSRHGFVGHSSIKKPASSDDAHRQWRAPAVVATATCFLLYITSWSIHALANTPMIFFTILPGAIISSIYTVVYVIGIHCAHKNP